MPCPSRPRSRTGAAAPAGVAGHRPGARPAGCGCGCAIAAASPTRRLHALTLLTLFLTFDLVLFGAFTRLTDSGLGCPDWPGCYGSASPLGARDADRRRAECAAERPGDAGKAWVEMIHRYLAMAVGVLILVMTAMAWRAATTRRSCRSRPGGPRDAGLGGRAGRLRRAHGDDEAVPGHRHAAPAGRHRSAGAAGGAGRRPSRRAR